MSGRERDLRATAKSAAAKSLPARRPSTVQNLWRQAAWGLAAVAALFGLALSSRDEAAMQRIGMLLVSLHLLSPPPAKHQFDAESAARQLAQAVRGLTEDRDRQAARLAALERDIGDITGSIKKQIDAVKAAKAEPPPWPENVPPVPMTPADVAAMVKTVSPAPAAAGPAAGDPSTAAADPLSPALPEAAANRVSAEVPAMPTPAYGADIGSAPTIKALHVRWTWLRTAHPALFEGLQPLVSLKQNARTNRMELHLVVGPYSNADAAAQFCDFIVPFHLTCEPAMFDGSRLALQ